MNDLTRIFADNADGPQVWKWHHYFDIYDRHLSRFRGTEAHVVEIGVHTSYSLRYGGGYRRRGSFIEFSKHLIDDLNAWFAHEWSRLKVSEFTSTTDSLHFYAGMLVIEKKLVSRLRVVRSGVIRIAEGHRLRPSSVLIRIADSLMRIIRS